MKSLAYRFYLLCTNNILVNNFFILTRLESAIAPMKHRYKKHRADKKRSLQEIAGFSQRPEINEYLEKSHRDLRETVHTYLPNGGDVLEIGCGPGLYLKDFNPSKYKLTAVDMTEDMIALAKIENPSCEFHLGNFMQVDIPKKFDLIYCVGALMYFPRMEIKAFFRQIDALLKPGGVAYINYPHAISYWDLFYPDSTYILYSPTFIEKILPKDLIVKRHLHAFDDRSIGKYDKRPYKSLNANTKQTYKNSSLLIIQKKP